jgi:hypothetical protein
MIRHYYAVAERGEGRTWWLSFPGRDGLVSIASDADDIVSQAQDALASVCMYPPVILPPAIEDGAPLPTNLSDFDQPAFVVVIPFAHTEAAKAAA